jgi:hypothetical protein
VTGRDLIEAQIEDRERSAARADAFAAEYEVAAQRARDDAANDRRVAEELRAAILPDPSPSSFARIQFVVQGQKVALVVPDDLSGTKVVRAAMEAAGIRPSEAALEWNVLDGQGFPVGLGADAGTIALMPSPIFVSPKPGVGG